MIEELRQWWQQLSPGVRVMGRDGAVALAALVAAPIISLIAREILRGLRFDVHLIPPWRLALLKREPAGERRRAWHIPPSRIVGWLCLLSIWAAAGCLIAAWHEWGNIIPAVKRWAVYAWGGAALTFSLMLVGSWFSRRVQDLVDIPWLQESFNHRLSGPAPAETFSFSVGRGITSLVYVIAVLTALLSISQERGMGALPEVLLTLLHLAVGALAAVAALALGWIGVAWLRVEGRRSVNEELGENSTHLAVLGMVICTVVLAIILLASRNLLPILLVVLGLAAVLWLLRGESWQIVRRVGRFAVSLFKPPQPGPPRRPR